MPVKNPKTTNPKAEPKKSFCLTISHKVSEIADNRTGSCLLAIGSKMGGAYSVRYTKDSWAFNYVHNGRVLRYFGNLPASASKQVEQWDTNIEKYGLEKARKMFKPFMVQLTQFGTAEVKVAVAKPRGKDKKPRKQYKDRKPHERYCSRRYRGQAMITAGHSL